MNYENKIIGGSVYEPCKTHEPETLSAEPLRMDPFLRRPLSLARGLVSPPAGAAVGSLESGVALDGGKVRPASSPAEKKDRRSTQALPEPVAPAHRQKAYGGENRTGFAAMDFNPPQSLLLSGKPL